STRSPSEHAWLVLVARSRGVVTVAHPRLDTHHPVTRHHGAHCHPKAPEHRGSNQVDRTHTSQVQDGGHNHQHDQDGAEVTSPHNKCHDHGAEGKHHRNQQVFAKSLVFELLTQRISSPHTIGQFGGLRRLK